MPNSPSLKNIPKSILKAVQLSSNIRLQFFKIEQLSLNPQFYCSETLVNETLKQKNNKKRHSKKRRRNIMSQELLTVGRRHYFELVRDQVKARSLNLSSPFFFTSLFSLRSKEILKNKNKRFFGIHHGCLIFQSCWFDKKIT